MVALVWLLLAVAPAAAKGPASSGGFAFAVISDLHIGEGVHDFGTPGYDDAPGGV